MLRNDSETHSTGVTGFALPASLVVQSSHTVSCVSHCHFAHSSRYSINQLFSPKKINGFSASDGYIKVDSHVANFYNRVWHVLGGLNLDLGKLLEKITHIYKYENSVLRMAIFLTVSWKYSTSHRSKHTVHTLLCFVVVGHRLIYTSHYLTGIGDIIRSPQCQYVYSETLQWRHNEPDCVSNHQPYDCLLNSLFRRRSKKTSKLRVTGLCEGNSPVTGEFPAKRASNAENVSILWCHHEIWVDIPCESEKYDLSQTKLSNSVYIFHGIYCISKCGDNKWMSLESLVVVHNHSPRRSLIVLQRLSQFACPQLCRYMGGAIAEAMAGYVQ